MWTLTIIYYVKKLCTNIPVSAACQTFRLLWYTTFFYFLSIKKASLGLCLNHKVWVLGPDIACYQISLTGNFVNEFSNPGRAGLGGGKRYLMCPQKYKFAFLHLKFEVYFYDEGNEM